MSKPPTYSIRDLYPEKIERTPVKPKFLEDLSLREIENDLESLVKIAMKTGATEAVPIRTSQLVIDERARWKCRIPVCFGYNTNPACPPFTPTAEETTRLASKYRHGVLYRLECPPSDVLFPKEEALTGFLAEAIGWANKTDEITGRIETEAQYLGHYHALGFKGGPCGHCGLFSPEFVADIMENMGRVQYRCNVLDNKTCRHYLHVRPAMEGSGFDCFAIGKKVGWDFYALWPQVDPAKTPRAMWMGVVLVI